MYWKSIRIMFGKFVLPIVFLFLVPPIFPALFIFYLFKKGGGWKTGKLEKLSQFFLLVLGLMFWFCFLSYVYILLWVIYPQDVYSYILGGMYEICAILVAIVSAWRYDEWYDWRAVENCKS